MLPSTLPSPPPSASSHTASSLPEPRLTALIPGSSKESALVNFVDGRLREVSARFERRFQNEPDISLPLSTNFPGYKTFSEIANDLDRIVDVIWVSATRKWAKLTLLAGVLRIQSLVANSVPPQRCKLYYRLYRSISLCTDTYSTFTSETGLCLLFLA